MKTSKIAGSVFSAFSGILSVALFLAAAGTSLVAAMYQSAASANLGHHAFSQSIIGGWEGCMFSLSSIGFWVFTMILLESSARWSIVGRLLLPFHCVCGAALLFLQGISSLMLGVGGAAWAIFAPAELMLALGLLGAAHSMISAVSLFGAATLTKRLVHGKWELKLPKS